ncbi:MAG TPA: hypothetical protein VKB86_17490 [Pyrinomonadaceae bacterium]|nr:hypothetical protein [Pyrinomonadaceae bacterium]
MNHLNPYDTFAGVFVPYFVLSSPHVSPAAKILYSLLASMADIRGESILNPALLAAKMGVEEEIVLQLVEELSSTRLLKVSQDPAGTEFLICHFPPNAWQKDKRNLNEVATQEHSMATPRLLKLPSPTAERSASSSNSSTPNGGQRLERQDIDGVRIKDGPSRFPKEVCIEYAKARQQAEGKIKNAHALGTAMAKTTQYDEEIELWIRSKDSERNIA